MNKASNTAMQLVFSHSNSSQLVQRENLCNWKYTEDSRPLETVNASTFITQRCGCKFHSVWCTEALVWQCSDTAWKAWGFLLQCILLSAKKPSNFTADPAFIKRNVVRQLSSLCFLFSWIYGLISFHSHLKIYSEAYQKSSWVLKRDFHLFWVVKMLRMGCRFSDR